MTEKSIQAFLNQLNGKKGLAVIFQRTLSLTVTVAKVWLEKPYPHRYSVFPAQDVYFILDNGAYIGAVLVMSDDLHWYVTPRYRGKGHLSMALKETILPHLHTTRQTQRFSIEKVTRFAAASERLALHMGFLKTADMSSKNEYILDFTKHHYKPLFAGYDLLISEDRCKELSDQIHFLGRSLRLLQSEIEMGMGDPLYAAKLMQYVLLLEKEEDEVEKVWYNSRNKSNYNSP